MLIKNSWAVILLGRTVSTLDSGKSKILESYPFINVHVFVADVTDASAISSIFTKIHSEIGPINICISNASYPPQLCPMSSGSIEDWFKSFEVMVKGGLIVAQEFLKHKSESNAAFINISSSATEARFVPGFSAYSSAKLAMAKAMLYLQAENADVRVVSVHPGVIRSDMTLDGEKDFGFEFDYDDCELWFSFEGKSTDECRWYARTLLCLDYESWGGVLGWEVCLGRLGCGRFGGEEGGDSEEWLLDFRIGTLTLRDLLDVVNSFLD
jgi:NAD(P)-dependent dehydrogenase (short-subunit alcohol dehydrogenase family)